MAISHFEHFTFLYKILTNILVLYFAAKPAGLPLSCDWCLQSADWGGGRGRGGFVGRFWKYSICRWYIPKISLIHQRLLNLKKILKRKHFLVDKNVHTASNGLQLNLANTIPTYILRAMFVVQGTKTNSP